VGSKNSTFKTCQAYVSELSEITDEQLAQVGAKLIVIGCGQPELITNYKKNTDFKHPVYADSTRSLYKILNMTKESLAGTPAGQERPRYASTSLLHKIVQGVKAGFQSPTHIGKQGNMGQLGGDFVFGPGQQCTFAHRMIHVEDHTDREILLTKAGGT